MEDDSLEDSRWSVGRYAKLIGQIIVCLVLIAVIAGAIYATVLPALTWHKEHPDKPGDHTEQDR